MIFFFFSSLTCAGFSFHAYPLSVLFWGDTEKKSKGPRSWDRSLRLRCPHFHGHKCQGFLLKTHTPRPYPRPMNSDCPRARPGHLHFCCLPRQSRRMLKFNLKKKGKKKCLLGTWSRQSLWGGKSQQEPCALGVEHLRLMRTAPRRTTERGPRSCHVPFQVNHRP